MSWGLTTSATVSALAAASTVGDDGDAVALLELAGPLGALLADHQLVDAAPGPDQSGEQGLAHHAGADDRCLAHGRQTYFLETRERAKKARFCGFSASRRMR